MEKRLLSNFTSSFAFDRETRAVTTSAYTKLSDFYFKYDKAKSSKYPS